ncbi:MerR family transcriptional regulator [Anaerosacchariphilus polymeriproducens]|uniref:MerR family transcriptional regulator n=1 Tax=Anaerosacchariphilus polymeriproducens TaxID=1812858 RepID=A0A371AYG7_9FIRM|nr:MerR family transcriptional regulator [Anaerosacchariphilus polymeriproducens]RDU24603.1 MerR family transcriptional regulator [Anaerosacchariphilus polymeriproducens]
MKIKQVEELVGITSKNIRFYEAQGLLTPDRAENGYREYRQNNIDTLKQIKLLRKFGVPVEEIKSVFNKSQSLDDCLEEHLVVLKKERENFLKMQKLVEAILKKSTTIETLETDKWLEEVEKLEKEGIDFVNLSKIDIHMKKKAGAFVGGIVMIIFMLFIMGLTLWGNSVDPAPFGILMALIGIPGVVIIGIIVAMKIRFKEIEGGEEDEASKY